MKNALTAFSNESAPDKRDYTGGTLPRRINTVIAGILAHLIEGRDPTGMEAVFGFTISRAHSCANYPVAPCPARDRQSPPENAPCRPD
jgi:hypothetical protein